jgi:fatty acid desaturase (delta-4 desaturase)
MAASGILRVDDFLYDAAALSRIHPGGALFVLQTDGTDATAVFNTSHRRPFPHEKYAQHRIDESKVPSGTPLPPRITANQDWTSYWQLCGHVKGVLDTKAGNSGFAPAHYYAKVAAIMLGVLFLDCYFLLHGRTVLLTLLAGFLRACVGLNIQHDANHGAVSRSPMVNRLLGLTQDYIGGSSISWIINHNVGHHAVCNDPGRDHDLDQVVLRLKRTMPWLPAHKYQHLYVWLLEALFGPVHMLHNAVFNFFSPESRRPLLVPFFRLNRALSLLTVARLVALFYLHPTAEMAWLTVLEYCFGGLWLAYLFLLSHNFEGVAKEGVDYGSGTDFVRNQVETSSNVGGGWLIVANGGLNIQIEHHLFPRVSHCHYAKLMPVVREFCRSKGFRYTHFPTLWDNTKSCFRHLQQLGAQS